MNEERFDRLDLIRLLQKVAEECSYSGDGDGGLHFNMSESLQSPSDFASRREAISEALDRLCFSRRDIDALIRDAKLGYCDDWLVENDDDR